MRVDRVACFGERPPDGDIRLTRKDNAVVVALDNAHSRRLCRVLSTAGCDDVAQKLRVDGNFGRHVERLAREQLSAVSLGAGERFGEITAPLFLVVAVLQEEVLFICP